MNSPIPSEKIHFGKDIVLFTGKVKINLQTHHIITSLLECGKVTVEGPKRTMDRETRK